MPKLVEVQPNTPRPQSVVTRLKEVEQYSYKKLYQVPDCILVAGEFRRLREVNDGKIADLMQEGLKSVEQVFRDIWCQEKQVGEFINQLLNSLPEQLQNQFQTEVNRVLAAKRWSLGGFKGALVARHVIQTEMVSDISGEVELPDALRTLYGLPAGETIRLSKKSKLRQLAAQEQIKETVKAAEEYLLNPPVDKELTSTGGEVFVGGSVELEVVEQPMAIGANGNGYTLKSIIPTSISTLAHASIEPPVDPNAKTQPTRVRPTVHLEPFEVDGGGSSDDTQHVVEDGATGLIPVEIPVDKPPVEASSEPKDETPNAVVSAAELPVVESVTSGTVLGEKPELSEEEIIAQRRRQYERDLDRILYRRGFKEGLRELGRLFLGIVSKKLQQKYIDSQRARLFETLVFEELYRQDKRFSQKMNWKDEYEKSLRYLKNFSYEGLNEYIESLFTNNMFNVVPSEENIPFVYSGIGKKKN